MNLYKCNQLSEHVYYVTADSYNEAEEILRSTLSSNLYGSCSHRVVASIEIIRGVIISGNLDYECGLYKIEADIKTVNIIQYVVANTFDDACTLFGDRCNKITLIAKNKTFCGKYQFNENGIGIILEPIKN